MALFSGLVAGAGSRSEAGIIVVSGDTNITNALAGNSTSIDPGNQRFFQNLLGSGNRVAVAGDSSSGLDALAVYANSYYNSLAGVSSTLTTSAITASTLSGASLFLSIGRNLAYSASEIALLSGFSAAGGTILVAGDGLAYANVNVTANALLLGLGSGMSIVTQSFDPTFTQAPPSRIAATSLTAGVNSFTYAYTSSVLGGTSLITTTTGATFVAATGLTPLSVPAPASLILVLIGVAGSTGARCCCRRTAA